jgi:hypothetical protein
MDEFEKSRLRLRDITGTFDPDKSNHGLLGLGSENQTVLEPSYQYGVQDTGLE